MEATELAGTLIIQDEGLLLLYREDEQHWELPGGKVREDESPTQAAVREAQEEICIDVTLEKPFFSGEFEHDGELFLWHGYIANTGDKPELQEEKFSELKWFDAEMLDEEELAPNVRQIEPALRRVLKAKE
ncbi:NUDIX hydrolase [Candidatus Nanosalina sp. VS9-1]|uniref:NUDIX hydrolase n=1 Tax=Candidatus Nanosalina sp. VS9-1 TaxID=3388566 RepID=UPI0039E06B1A